MKIDRQEELNRTLSLRRALMHRRILIGRILLGAWAAATVLNLILLYGSSQMRFCLSSVTADLLLMLRMIYPDSSGTLVALAVSVAIPCLLIAAAVFWKHESAGLLRSVAFLLCWLDVVIGVWLVIGNAVPVFGEGSNRTFVILANLALHVLLIWHISRARRAITSLDVLPESEIEGDPFDEVCKGDDDQ